MPSEPPAGRSLTLAAGGAMRGLTESIVCLLLAVMLFRGFAAEGYLISTGSMAPSLLGFHKRIVCPTCRFPFAFGVAWDRSVHAGGGGLDGSTAHAVCPNCSQAGIELTRVPRNYGDQLLVHKHAFQFRAPTRWEVAVFRNPNRSTEAYVKRIVGLPGEQVMIVGGDVYIDGDMARKSFEQQREMRILVFDHSFRPRDDRGWIERWIPEGRSPAGAWEPAEDGFLFRPGEPRADGEPAGDRRPAWLAYRHWIRAGGTHETTVPLGRWDPRIDEAASPFLPVRFEQAGGQLSAAGVINGEMRSRLRALTSDPQILRAIERLCAESHLAPVTDVYGYNLSQGSLAPEPVRDLMIEATVELQGDTGEFIVRMTDGSHVFDCVFDLQADAVLLMVDGRDRPVRSAALPAAVRKGAVRVEMSLFDGQVVVAVDGKPVFSAWERPASHASRAAPRMPVRFGASGLEANVEGLKLYRDVHYTSVRTRNGTEEPFTLGEDEYFVLGDNSPVSHDSRRWESGAVPGRLLLGRPFLVHLPSRLAKVRVGQREAHIRIPDFGRIRYIR